MATEQTEIPVDVILSKYASELAAALQRALLAEAENLVLRQQLEALRTNEAQ